MSPQDVESHQKFRDEYDLDDSASENFFDREQQSMERLAESFARRLVAAMLEAF